MGGIAGVLSFRSDSQSQANLRGMSHAIAHRGPAGETIWQHGPLGLVHRRDHIGPPIARKGQPLADATGRYTMICAGRVFNWRELANTFAARGAQAPPADCLSTMLAWYVSEGPAAFSRFNGAFACAIWDNDEQTLLLARDHFGIKPLYFSRTSSAVFFASEIKAILAHPDMSAAPDDLGIAEFLSVNRFLLLTGTTCYAGVRKVMPGHYLKLGASREESAPYWSIDPQRSDTYADEEERVEAVRELMIDAIRLRLPEEANLGAALTGGFDSSSIVCLLRHLLDEEGRRDTRIDTFSYNFGTAEADEPHLIEVASRRASTTHHPLYVLESGFFDDLDPVIVANDGPVVESTALLLYKKKREMSRLGVGVSFSGIGGDELFQGELNYFADLLRSGQVAQLVREIRGVYPVDPLTGKRTALWPMLRAFMLSPLWPDWMRQIRGTHNGLPYPPDWIAQSLFARSGLDSTLPDPQRPRFESRYDQSCWDLFHYELVGGAVHYHDCAGASFAIDTRFPLIDVRLVEAMFATPRPWKISEGRFRTMQKRTMQPFVPPEIIDDHFKKDHHPTVKKFMQKALREQVNLFLAGHDQPSRTYIDWAALLRHAEPFLAGRAYNPLPIWLALALDRWLVRAFGRT